MSHAIVVRKTWSLLSIAEVEKAYAAAQKIRAGKPTVRYTRRGFDGAPRDTVAESWGVLIKQRFAFYEAVLKAMKPSRTWVALQTHINEHTHLNPLPLVDGYTQKKTEIPVATIGDVDAYGWSIDTLTFDFKWVDNTSDFGPAWKPWNWEVRIESRDQEDEQIFLDEASGRAFVQSGESDTVDFYGFEPAVPALSCYPKA